VFGTRLINRGEKDLAPLREITTQTREASALLTKVFDQKGKRHDQDCLRIKEISEICAAMVRETAERLKHSLASSFDREDVYALVLGMSTIVHQLEMLTKSVNRYKVRHYTPEMIGLADRIRLIVLELDQLVPMINRPRELEERLRIVQRIQKESQLLHRDALGKLFRSVMPATDALMYKDLYDYLETILARCQYVGSLMERVSIKQA
jgi:uncharacterized protein Yka (UPF0111/DUF47 family)